MRNQIDAAMIFARADFVNVNGMRGTGRIRSRESGFFIRFCTLRV
jgi:hypothetical protein